MSENTGSNGSFSRLATRGSATIMLDGKNQIIRKINPKFGIETVLEFIEHHILKGIYQGVPSLAYRSGKIRSIGEEYEPPRAKALGIL